MYQIYQKSQVEGHIDDDIIRRKIENTIGIVCPLYKSSLITDAYIIGSVAQGNVRKESDIDILIVNPEFQFYIDDLGPDEEGKNLKEVVDKLKDMGVEFKLLKREKEWAREFWYQLYKDETFHIIPQKIFFNNLPNIQITEDLCR